MTIKMPHRYWDLAENRIKKTKRLVEKLRPNKNPQEITYKDFVKNGLRQLIKKCGDSPFLALKEAGYEITHRLKKKTDVIKPINKELKQKCEELGYNITKAGEFYGISRATAWRWMRADEIETNKSNQEISRENKPSKEEFGAKCKELGYNTVKVGEYYKISDKTAWVWMKSYGIKTKISKSNALESAVQDYLGGGK